MKLRVVALIAFIAITNIACDGARTPSVKTVQKVAENIRYSQDQRTKLCFASLSSMTYLSWNVVSVTNVPCTPEVEALVGK